MIWILVLVGPAVTATLFLGGHVMWAAALASPLTRAWANGDSNGGTGSASAGL